MEKMLIEMGRKGKESAVVLSRALSSQKDMGLTLIAEALEKHSSAIVKENKKDIKEAKQAGISDAMLDRLVLNSERIKAIADSVREIVALPDPVGITLEGTTRPNGLEITKKTVPLGVIGLIYESRPNVTVDCAVLCLKSGNACILRGGSEAIHSNKILADTVRDALEEAGLPRDAVQLVESTDRDAATMLMRLNGYIDALIPRGGQGLIQSVVKNATVPVIETGAGNCHIYVDSEGDLNKAIRITENAKVSRPSVCNAVEKLLVHKDIAKKFLPMVVDSLADKVELRGCRETISLVGLEGKIKLATEDDWTEEYNDYILTIKIVDSIEDAIGHIAKHSTHHSDAIITESYQNSEMFLNSVDSATVYVNASTRFTDGGEFGFGAEIGISNQKLHVRGPMGLPALTSYKYLVRGNGQIRQ